MAATGTTIHAPWQFGKSDKECNKYMLEKELYTDVTFRVGIGDKGDTDIKAHKYILMSRSPAFEAMLCKDVQDGPIQVPDTDGKTFQLLLRYLYYGYFPEDSPVLLPLLHLATKYRVPALENRCEERLKVNINIQNVCFILEQSLFYSKANLTSDCMELIRNEIKKISKEKTFLDLKQKTLAYILEDDELHISEEELFEFCLSWAKNRCKVTGNPPDSETIRMVLGDALYGVRFPTMTSSALANKVAPMHILTESEMLQLLILSAGCNAENKTRFKSKHRIGNRNILSCDRFGSFEESGSWSHISGPDAIAFKTDRNVLFHGMKVSLSDDNKSRHSIEVQLYQGKNCLGSVTCETSGGSQQKEIHFPDPVKIVKNSIYDIVLKMKGPCTFKGTLGKTVIPSHGVKFTFFSSNMDENGTNVAGGQIPGILFTIIH